MMAGNVASGVGTRNDGPDRFVTCMTVFEFSRLKMLARKSSRVLRANFKLF